MKAHWWSCVLGLLCMPAEVILYTWTVSQNPLSTTFMSVNSSSEITCSTSLSNPTGLNLRRLFHGKREVLYLSLKDGRVTENTTAAEFAGRIHVTPAQQTGVGFTFQLSPLQMDDTDLYYCTWWNLELRTMETEKQSSNGTVIIVGERDPQEQCEEQIYDITLITLSFTTITVLSLVVFGVLIWKCTRFKKRFRPARARAPARQPNSPHYFCPQHRIQHCPYMTTSVNTLDFRGIL